MGLGVLNTSLVSAAAAGDLEWVKELVSLGADPTDNDSLALGVAAETGHADCVEYLIGVSVPTDNDSAALRWAARDGMSECVRLLVPVSDAAARENQALFWALQFSRTECVKALLPVSDIPLVRRRMEESGLPDRDEKVMMLDALSQSYSLSKDWISETVGANMNIRGV